MSLSRTRLFLSIASMGLAAALAWVVVPRFLGRRAVSFVVRAAETDAVFAGRDESPSRVGAGDDFYVEPVDEITARKLFVLQPADFRFDPTRYYGYRPGIETRIDWEEHPAGMWTRRTNVRGLREDDELELVDAELAVLVTGDSHTDGVCNNSESFTNLLETELGADGSAVAWNAGVVGYSFYNYLGVLTDYLAQEPDVFVVAVYGGNDFLEVLRPHHYFRGSVLPPRRQGYRSKIIDARAVSSTALAQGLNQVLYFQEYPDQIEVALEAALVTSAEIKRICDERGVRLIYAYIPPAFEAGWPALEKMSARAREVLGLTEADLRIARRLADDFLEGLGAQEIEYVDLAPVFRASDTPCYWERDLHINLRGHARVAEALAERLRIPASSSAAIADLTGDAEDAESSGVGATIDGGELLLAEGAWVDGKRDGPWVRRYHDGTLYSRGAWRRGQRTGDWTWWYEDGSLKKQGRYADGAPEGPWLEWHRNGVKRREGVWARGRPHGYWQQWYDDGTLASEGAYEDGVRHGVWATRLPGNQPDTRATYQRGVLEGQFKKWAPDGEIVSLGDYSAGERSGVWQSWWPDGNPKARGEFDGDLRSGPWVFWVESGEYDAEKTGWYRGGEWVCALGRPGDLSGPWPDPAQPEG